jgi:DHA1 family bicyclomycin/chloramphenicol resistance-like MFS transporter
VFLGHALTGGIAIAGMFSYIAGSPFVFIKLYGVPAEHFGWLFGANAAGFILVAQVNARLLARRGPAFLLARTVWVYLGGVGAARRQCAAHRSALAVVDSAVCLHRQPGLHPAQRLGLRDERPGRPRRQRLGDARLPAIQRGRRRALVGVLHDGSAMPMAMVISLCGILVVSAAMLTQRLQNARALVQAQV